MLPQIYHLFADTEGNSEFCVPETLRLDEAKPNEVGRIQV
jgi:hypothetical protein